LYHISAYAGKRNMPKITINLSEAAAALGREGGKAKVPKGFAVLGAEHARRAGAKGRKVKRGKKNSV
jgi:hypothetical protein